MIKKKNPRKVGRPRKPTDEEVEIVADRVAKTMMYELVINAYPVSQREIPMDMMDRDPKFLERVEKVLLSKLTEKLDIEWIESGE